MHVSVTTEELHLKSGANCYRNDTSLEQRTGDNIALIAEAGQHQHCWCQSQALKTHIQLEILCGLIPASQIFATKVASVCFWLKETSTTGLVDVYLELHPSLRPVVGLWAFCPRLHSQPLGVERAMTDGGRRARSCCARN